VGSRKVLEGSGISASAAMAGSFEVMGISGDFSAAAAVAGDFEVSGLGRGGVNTSVKYGHGISYTAIKRRPRGG